MNLLEKIGIALRDGVYEVFMGMTDTTDLKELKEKGFAVKEMPLSPHPASMDKLYILTNDKKIWGACSLVINQNEPEVKFHTPVETLEVIRRITRAGNERVPASKPKTKHIRRMK